MATGHTIKIATHKWRLSIGVGRNSEKKRQKLKGPAQRRGPTFSEMLRRTPIRTTSYYYYPSYCLLPKDLFKKLSTSSA